MSRSLNATRATARKTEGGTGEIGSVVKRQESGGVDAVDGVAFGVEVGVLLLAGGVGLGEAADAGLGVEGGEVVDESGPLGVTPCREPGADRGQTCRPGPGCRDASRTAPELRRAGTRR